MKTGPPVSGDARFLEKPVEVPRLQAEGPFTFPARPVQLTPPAREFIPDYKDARRVFAHGLVKRLEGGIIHDQAPQLRFYGFVLRPVGRHVPLLRCRLVLLFPRRAPKFVFFFLLRVILQRLFVLMPPFGLDLIQGTGCRLNDRGLHEAGWSNDAAPKVRHNHPSGIVRLRLNEGPPVHSAGKTEHHYHGRAIHRDLHSFRHVRHEGTEGIREKVFGEGFHGRKLTLDRFRFRPIVRPFRSRLVSRFFVRQSPPCPQFGERRHVHHRRSFGQFPESLEGATRFPPVRNITLRRQARKLQDADGNRHAQQIRCHRRRMFPAQSVIVGKDDDMPVSEVLRPSRVQPPIAGPTRIAGRHQPPIFQGVNVFFPFGKIDGLGFEHFGKARLL
jgi:hypothetical protein